MSRTVMDGAFQAWEVFVNTGPSGFSRPPRIVFRCVSDPSVPSRMAPFAGEPLEALSLVDSGPVPDLLELLGKSQPLS